MPNTSPTQPPEQHDEWDDDQILEEADRIRAEFAAQAPSLTAGLDGFPGGMPGDAGDPDDPTPEQ